MRSISPQGFQRNDDGILIFLHPDQWTDEIPLPPQSAVVHLGEQHESPFYPQWEFRLEPDKTIELLIGYFVEPCTLDQAIPWHRDEMVKRGWSEIPERGFAMDSKASLFFQKLNVKVSASINLQWWEELQETTAMIRYTVEHPWQKPQLELELESDTVEETAMISEEDARQFQELLAKLAELVESEEPTLAE